MSTPGLVVLAHGSPDPRSRAALSEVLGLLRTQAPGLVCTAAFLNHHGPTLADTARAASRCGLEDLVVVPYLLTSAYHARIDVPAALTRARTAAPGLHVRATPPLAGHPALLDAAARRADPHPTAAVVLAAGGSSDPDGAQQVHAAAAAIQTRLGRPVVAAFAGHQPPTIRDAIQDLREQGMPAVVVPYLLAPGLLADRIAAQGTDSGAPTTRPLGPSHEIAAAVVSRCAEARPRRRPRAPREPPPPQPGALGPAAPAR